MNQLSLKYSFASLVVAAVFLGNFSGHAWADEPFYTESDKPGYWWYKDPKEEEKKEKEPEKNVEVKKIEEPEVIKTPARRLPKLSDYSYEQLWNMHPQDYKILLDDFRDKAVMTLDPNDIKEHKTLQDLARRKAVAFMNVDQYVTQQTPSLSLENDVPIVSPGRRAQSVTAKNDLKQVLAANKDEYAILHFTADNCPYCEEQSKILDFFSKGNGWSVMDVNLSDNPKGGEAFGISVTPTTVLIKKGNPEYFIVSSGVIALSQINDRVYGGTKILSGETSIQQYGVKDYQRGGGMDPMAPLERSKKKGSKNSKP